jgi:tetratricopeptide (TPR) repeat protein
VEAEFQLGELIFHWGSLMGIPASEAAGPFRRVVAAEPDNFDAVWHLARLAARDGHPDRVDALVAAMTRIDPDAAALPEMDALRAFLSGDQAWQARAIGALGPGRDREALERLAALTSNLEAVERLTLAGLAADRPPHERARMEVFLAQVQLARGRYVAAVGGIQGAASLPAARRLEYSAMLATAPLMAVSRPELERLRTELAAHPDLDLQEAGGPIAGSGVEYPHLLWPGLFREVRMYLLGALHLALDDRAGAVAVADSLAFQDASNNGHFPYHYLSRARLELGGGTPEVGLRLLGSAPPPPHRTFETLVDHGRPYERWLRAELLRESGRVAEALRWYGTFPDPMGRDLHYLAPSHLRRAQLHEASGDLDQAAAHYHRFVELWASADPPLQPQVNQARQRLRELASR